MKQSPSASRVAAHGRLFTCAFMVVAASSAAMAASGTWTGSSSVYWNVDGNWSASPYPGSSGSSDTALIDVATNMPATYASANISKTVASITVDADANAAAVVLKVIDGSLSVTGLTRILAEKSSAVDAKLWVNAGTFDPEQLEFEGDTNDGVAVGVFDVNCAVDADNNHAGTDTLFEGQVHIYVGDARVTMRDLEMGAGANLSVFGQAADSRFQMSSIDLVDGASDYRPIRLEAAANCQLTFKIP